MLGIIFYLFSAKFYNEIKKRILYAEKRMQRLSASEIVYGACGDIIFLLITTLITKTLLSINKFFGALLIILINIIAAIIGADVMIKKKDDITDVLLNMKKGTPKNINQRLNLI